jgi:hypothetical protein
MAGIFFDIFAKDKTGRVFDSVKGKVGGLKSSFDNLGKSLGGLKGLIAGVFTFRFINDVAQSADRVQKLGIQFKISTEILSQFRHVANDTGVDLEDIAKSMRFLAKNSIEASENVGSARDAFNTLGIDARKFKELSIDDQFVVMAEALQGIENPSKRVEVAMAVMGKSGAEMIQVMEGGGEAVRAMQQRADELGYTLSQTAANDIAAMNDSFGAMGTAIKGVVQDLLALFAPAIKVVADALTDVFLGAINFVKDAFKEFVAFLINSWGYALGILAEGKQLLANLPGNLGDSYAREAAELRNQADVLKAVTGETDKATESQKKNNKELESAADLLKKVQGTLPGKAKGLDNVAKASKKATQKVKSDFDSLEQTVLRSADNVQDRWADALFGIGGGFETLGDTAVNELRRIGAEMLKSVINKSFGFNQPTPLPWLAGGGGGGGGIGGGGLFSSIAGGLGDFLSKIPFFGEGGNFMGGQPMVVGDRGAEMIVPKSGGTVIPNHAMGGRPVNVQVNISTPDINGFRRSQGQIAAQLAESVRRGSRNL